MSNKKEEGEIKNKLKSGKSKTYKCFVIQPSGVKVLDAAETNFDDVYKSLTPLQNKKHAMPIELTRADIKSYDDTVLKESRYTQLKSSDFYIADVTGNNPDVICEIGFVIGIGGEDRIILITQDPTSIPADLKGSLYVRYKTNALEDLATDIEQHLSRIKDTIDTRDSTETSDPYDVEAYAKRSNVDFNLMFGQAKEKIDILQTNLVTIGTNYMSVLREALERNENLNIRILTLDPQSQYVGVRAMQLGFEDIGVYRNELSSSLDLLKTQFGGFKGRVKIRKYDEFPLQLTYITDKEIVSSVISVTGRSRDNVAFKIDKSMPGVIPSFIDHFETLWDHIRTKKVLEG